MVCREVAHVEATDEIVSHHKSDLDELKQEVAKAVMVTW